MVGIFLSGMLESSMLFMKLIFFKSKMIISGTKYVPIAISASIFNFIFESRFVLCSIKNNRVTINGNSIG